VPTAAIGGKYSFEMEYYTLVDISNAYVTSVSNTATDGRGNSGIGIGEVEANYTNPKKKALKVTWEEVIWQTTFEVSGEGLSNVDVIDALPSFWYNNKNLRDTLQKTTLEVTGLVDGEKYDYSESTSDGTFMLTFYYGTESGPKSGLTWNRRKSGRSLLRIPPLTIQSGWRHMII